jgi:hypothetical protein
MKVSNKVFFLSSQNLFAQMISQIVQYKKKGQLILKRIKMFANP